MDNAEIAAAAAASCSPSPQQRRDSFQRKKNSVPLNDVCDGAFNEARRSSQSPGRMNSMMRQDTLAMAEQCTRMSDKVYDTAIKKSVKFAKQRVIGLRDEVKEILVAKKETVVHKVAFEYDMSSAGVLSHVKGTFWPLVAVRFELYVSSQGLELQSFAYASRSTGVRIPAWTGVPRGTHGASRMVRAPSCQRRTGAVV
jgi:hypothetical protein